MQNNAVRDALYIVYEQLERARFALRQEFQLAEYNCRCVGLVLQLLEQERRERPA